MRFRGMCAFVALSGCVWAASADGVVVTITSGSDAGLVVFDAGGFETQLPGPLLAPTVGSYTVINPANGASTVYTGSSTVADGPTAAYEGTNYLGFSRITGGTSLASDFTRSINFATESFTLEYAGWGNDSVASYTLGDASIVAGTNSTAGVLSNWRYNPGSVGGSGFGQFGGTDDQLQTLAYNMDGWNTFLYSWDHITQQASVTLNGATVPLQRTNTSASQPVTISRFLMSTGPGTIYLDTVPEPASFGLVVAGAALMMGYRSRSQG